jgi:hypothetical protein
MLSFQDPESHFDRATTLLNKSDLMSIFYAALEFRFAVEARLSHYAERADDISNKASNPWKVKALARHVNSVFGDDDRTYQIEMKTPTMTKPIIIEYTPITPEIRSILGKVNNFLHYPGVLQCVNDGKEDHLRSLLNRGLEQLKECLSGGLQGPLIHKKNGQITMVIDAEKYPQLKDQLKSGGQISLRINVEPFLKED